MNDSPENAAKPVPPVESSDDREIALGFLWKATLGLVAIALLIHVGLYVMDGMFAAADERRERRPTALEAAGRGLPPEPRLQAAAATDLADIRGEEVRRLASWEWLSPARTAARIPIERAMEIVAARGVSALATLPAEPAAPASALAAPSAAPVPSPAGAVH